MRGQAGRPGASRRAMMTGRTYEVAVLVGVITLALCTLGGLCGEFILARGGLEVPDTLTRGSGAAQGALAVLVTQAMQNRRELKRQNAAKASST